MKALIILPIFLLAACASKPAARPEPQIVTVEVPVAVAQPCVPESLGPAPDYVDTAKALRDAGPAGDPDAIAKRLQLLYGGRAQRDARLGELEPVIAGCPRGRSK